MLRRVPQILAVLASAAVLCTGCGGHKPHYAHPAPVHRSAWQLPAASGGPSVTNFCSLFAAEVEHLRALGNRPSAQAFVQALYDLAAEAPSIAAAAPPEIAPAANVYFSDMALTYKVLVDAQTHQPGPDFGDLKKTVSGQNPQVPNQVTAFAQENCHFDPNTTPPHPS